MAGGGALDGAASQNCGRPDQAFAPRIPRQIGRNSIERIAAMRFGIVRRVGAEKAVEGFLQEIVRQLTVAGDPREVRPHSAGGPFVKCAECVFVHHEIRARVLEGVRAIANRNCRVTTHMLARGHFRRPKPSSPDCSGRGGAGGGGSISPSFREITKEIIAEITNPRPSAIPRTPSAWIPCETSLATRPLTTRRPMPPASSTTPPCTAQRIRASGAPTLRGPASSLIGDDSRNFDPAGDCMYASKSSFAVNRSRIFVWTSVCTLARRLHRR